MHAESPVRSSEDRSAALEQLSPEEIFNLYLKFLDTKLLSPRERHELLDFLENEKAARRVTPEQLAAVKERLVRDYVKLISRAVDAQMEREMIDFLRSIAHIILSLFASKKRDEE
jgi:hypothetical protein